MLGNIHIYVVSSLTAPKTSPCRILGVLGIVEEGRLQEEEGGSPAENQGDTSQIKGDLYRP